MTSDDRSANLMFLLALSPLAAGCPGDDTSTSNTTTPDPTTSTSGMDTSGPGTGPGTDSGSGSGSGDTTSSMDTTAGPGTDSSSGDTTSGLECVPKMKLPTEIDPACTAYVDQLNECYYDGGLTQECLDYYSGYCQYNIEYYTMTSETCGMAWTDLLVCTTGLSCKELEMIDQLCMDQLTAYETECGVMKSRGMPRLTRRR
ncbi:MAG: hypothetical protein KDK70_11945 [Myxococcales bacterium]|nr:hypothetical protein [Myxococcales bacterium]